MKGITNVMKEPVPEEWVELIKDMIDPSAQQNYNLSVKQQELLHNYQIKRQSQTVTALDKKNLCLKAGLSLAQVNEWLLSNTTGIGLVSVNQTSFADDINGILEVNAIREQNLLQPQPDINYLSQIFGGFGSEDLQFENIINL